MSAVCLWIDNMYVISESRNLSIREVSGLTFDPNISNRISIQCSLPMRKEVQGTDSNQCTPLIPYHPRFSYCAPANVTYVICIL